MKHNPLSDEEKRILLDKGTEYPFSGIYNEHFEKGIYLCKQCNAPLFRSQDKFHSGCGWPSFDEQIGKTVATKMDEDGRRVEIVCANCQGHLGHVFYGEQYTAKDTRYCVNSLSLQFVADQDKSRTIETAYFAAGCFWGVEYYMQKAHGVVTAVSGYMGGDKINPNYEEVCSGNTNHAETVEVIFDTTLTNFETLAKLFFEIHDFTQINGQGPDIGTQYRSVIFYTNTNQKEISEKLSNILQEKGYKVATQLVPAEQFWKAENYHQQYYFKKGSLPYCHFRRTVF